jgi:homoserine acetyltransferase
LLEFLLKGYVLKIDTLFALIGGSVGGGIAWEIGFGAQISSKFYSIATDWKATDWLIANCYLQES